MEASKKSGLGRCPHMNPGSGIVGRLCRRDLEQLISSNPQCDVCRLRGPNKLWLCLFPDCYMMGCSDDDRGCSPDHSTKHHAANPAHVVQLSVSDGKVWCYACIKEVTSEAVHVYPWMMQPAAANDPPSRSPTAGGGENVDYRPLGEDEEETPVAAAATNRGLVGLANLGNTCYMNAALQCLSNVPALTNFFLACSASFETDPSSAAPSSNDYHPGAKQGVAIAYTGLLRQMWLPSDHSGRHVAPSRLLAAFKATHPSFRGFQQHDAQEFLRCFLDQLHEELMEPVIEGDEEEDEDEEEVVDKEDLEEDVGPHDTISGSGTVSTGLSESNRDETAVGVCDEDDMGQDDKRVGGEQEPEAPRQDPEQQADDDPVSAVGQKGTREDELEYETADSGVSEQSSGSRSNSTSPENPTDKRRSLESKLAPAAAAAAGPKAQAKPREDQQKYSSSTSPCESGMDVQSCCQNSSRRTSTASGDGCQQKQPQGGGGQVGAAWSASPAPSSPSRRSCEMQQFRVHRRRPRTYKSVISDIFDGRLVSTVQCLSCLWTSSTSEVFQDLSLPIPTFKTAQSLKLIGGSSSSSSSSSSGIGGSGTSSPRSLSPSPSFSSLQTNQQQQQQQPQLITGHIVDEEQGQGWLSWMWNWLTRWVYGSNISLQDCLAYFFSADELKGDNMYSCEKCKKLRNGIKVSRVTELPDILCIHLKRFRHDFAFSTKINSRVTFPLVDLDMSPWIHMDYISKETMYDLVGVVCHHGTSGGGHYTSFALNPLNQEWYEFDDSSVSRVEAAEVLASEAYVLFYRKNNRWTERVREEVQNLLCRRSEELSLMQYYVSKQWINKLQNFSEPGPIDNSDFLCRHGGVLPTKVERIHELYVALPRSVWELLYQEFGCKGNGLAAAACNRIYECIRCKTEMEALMHQKAYELEEFKRLYSVFQSPDGGGLRQGTGLASGSSGLNTVHCIASSWYKLWEAFVTGRARDPPGAIDNRAIITTANAVNLGHHHNPYHHHYHRHHHHHQASGFVPVQVLKTNSDHLRVSRDIWSMFVSIYGGGPEVILKSNGVSIVNVSPASPGYQPPQHLQGGGVDSLGRIRSVSECSFRSYKSTDSSSAVK